MLNYKERIKRNFSKSAKEYDNFASLHRKIASRVLEQIPRAEYKNILDIGCGTGFLTMALAERFPRAIVHAVDLAPGMVEYAKDKNKDEYKDKVKFREGDGEGLPFVDDAFDLVVSSSAFQWMDPQKCFFEAKRVLKQEGKFSFSFFGPRTLSELKKVIGNKAYFKYPEAAEIKNLLEGLGFWDVDLSSEVRRELFPDFLSLLQFLKSLGAHGGRDPLGFKSRKVLQEADECYSHKFFSKAGIYASFEVIFGKGRL